MQAKQFDQVIPEYGRLRAIAPLSPLRTEKEYERAVDMLDMFLDEIGEPEYTRSAAPLSERIAVAFVFGSVAKRSDTATSDINVLVLSDSVDYADMYPALQSAEAKLGRTINPTVYETADWRKKRKSGNAFATKVRA